MANQQILQIVIQAIDNASKTLKAIGANVNFAGEGIQRMGESLARTSTAVGLGMGFAVRAGVDFSQKMANVAAVSSANAEQFKQLEKVALDLGAQTKFSASQAADAMGYLAMAGNDVDKIVAAMPDTLKLAAAANLDMGTSADIVTNIMAGFGMEAGQLKGAVDILSKAFTSSNTDLRQLGEAMKYAGPVASSVGMSLEETAAAAGLMGNAGIQASMAGTSLRGAITRLISPTKEAEKIMQRLGLTVLDSSGKFVGITEIVRQLEKSGADTADVMDLFGQRAGPAMQVLIEQGSDALDSFTHSLENAGGTADRIASVQMRGMHGAIEEAKGAMETAAITMTGSLAPALTTIANGVQSAASAFATLSPETQRAIGVAGLLIAAAAPLLIVIGSTITAIGTLTAAIGVATAASVRWLAPLIAKTVQFGLLTAATIASSVATAANAVATASATAASWAMQTALTASTIAARALGVAMTFALGPIGLIIVAIAAAVAAGWYLYQNWDQVKVKIGQAWEVIQGYFTRGKDAVIGAWDAMWQWVSNTATGFIDGIQGAVDGMLGWITQKIDSALSLLRSARETVSNFASSAASTAANALQSVSPLNFASGGIVPQYRAGGGLIDWSPRGTDTVPAMLTPGELVLNRAQQRGLAGQLAAPATNITINVTGNQIRSDADIDQLVDKIGRALARKRNLVTLGAA